MQSSSPAIADSDLPHHSSLIRSQLTNAIRTIAQADGVTPTPLSSVWALKISESVPYHRGRNSGLSVTIAISGRKSVTVCNTQADNELGRILVMHGLTVYDAFVHASQTEPYIALKLQLPTPLVVSTLLSLCDGPAKPLTETLKPAPTVSDSKLDVSLEEPLLRLLHSFNDPSDSRVLAPLCFQEICYRILRSEAFTVARASVTTADHKLLDAMNYIDAHANENLTVEAIASRVAMSASSFAHRFTMFCGTSPMQYRKQVRLKNARVDLLSDKTTIATAAETSGYASVSHFSRDFKAEFGLAPREYVNAKKFHQLGPRSS